MATSKKKRTTPRRSSKKGRVPEQLEAAFRFMAEADELETLKELGGDALGRFCQERSELAGEIAAVEFLALASWLRERDADP